ncbi:MAG: nucleoside deaminase [Abitibacteriaceae bacterium]|nr:nucleoside deaminase [Abditibacteriaceae bacterium]
MREALREARQCLRNTEAPYSPLTPPPLDSPHSDIRQASSVNRQSNNPQSAIRNPQSDVPVGAVCVWQGEIIGRGHNRREVERDPTAHAEVLALQAAATHLGDWHLTGVMLYVTLEPCVMCAGAIWLARVEQVVFGAWDERAGACGSVFDIVRDPRLNHRPQLRGGVLADECAALLKEFFATQRKPPTTT